MEVQHPDPDRPASSNSSPQADVSAQPRVCPFLGGPTDRDQATPYPSNVNNCHSGRFPVPVSAIHQTNYCLSVQYELCPIFNRNTAKAIIKEETNTRPLSPEMLPEETVANLTETETPEPVVDERVLSWQAEGDALIETISLFDSQGMFAANSASSDKSSPVSWNEPPQQVDIAAAPGSYLVPQPFYRRIAFRYALIGLFLLALIPLGWWLINSLSQRPDQSQAPGFVQTDETAALQPTLTVASNAGDEGEPGSGVPGEAAPEGSPTAEAEAEMLVDSTATLTAEATWSNLERIAATATALFVNATVVTDCVPPYWWVPYTIEEGDTIEALAQAHEIQPEALITANCLAQPVLEIGETIVLPPDGSVADETVQPWPTPTATIVNTPLPTSVPIQIPIPTFPVNIFPTAVPPPPPTVAPPTAAPSTAVPPTDVPPPEVEPTAVPPTIAPPTEVPPTAAPPVETEPPPPPPTEPPP